LGSHFTFDSINSRDFGLIIASINVDLNSAQSGSGFEIQTASTGKNAEKLFLGVRQSAVLEFSLEIVSEKAIDLATVLRIKHWLFGAIGYKKLQIWAPWYEDFYFNCILKPSEDIKFGGEFYGFKCAVECNSPYAYTFPLTTVWKFDDSRINSFQFNNFSADLEGLRPKIEFTLSKSGTFFRIENLTTRKIFSMRNLQPNEKITVDNKNQIITSSTGLRRFSNLETGENKGFLSFAHGINKLDCHGLLSDFKMTYQFAVRLGGG